MHATQGRMQGRQGIPGSEPTHVKHAQICCPDLLPSILRISHLQSSRKPSVDSATSVLNSLVAADGRRVAIVRAETYQAALKAAQGAMRKDIPVREPSRNTNPGSRS